MHIIFGRVKWVWLIFLAVTIDTGSAVAAPLRFAVSRTSITPFRDNPNLLSLFFMLKTWERDHGGALMRSGEITNDQLRMVLETLGDSLEKALGESVDVLIASDDETLAAALADGRADLAIYNSGPAFAWTWGRHRDLRPLATVGPFVETASGYRTFLVVARHSRILRDLSPGAVVGNVGLDVNDPEKLRESMEERDFPRIGHEIMVVTADGLREILDRLRGAPFALPVHSRYHLWWHLDWLFRATGLEPEGHFTLNRWTNVELRDNPEHENADDALTDVILSVPNPVMPVGDRKNVAQATIVDEHVLGLYQIMRPGAFMKYLQPIAIDDDLVWPPAVLVIDPRCFSLARAKELRDRLLAVGDRFSLLSGMLLGYGEFMPWRQEIADQYARLLEVYPERKNLPLFLPSEGRRP